MRDVLKNEEYFQERITYEKGRIRKFTKVLEQLDENNERGRQNVYGALTDCYDNLFKLSYSAGASVEEIYPYYEEQVKLYSVVCSEDYSMYDLVEIFSLAVFYEAKKGELLPYLLTIVEKCKLNDGMINLCLRYLDAKCGECKTSRLSFLNPLLDSAEDKNKLLREILKKWYRYHKDAYWYDSHKHKTDTYRGYWSFDLGAIAKILRLDDSDLNGKQYYPYDLVHFEY